MKSRKIVPRQRTKRAITQRKRMVRRKPKRSSITMKSMATITTANIMTPKRLWILMPQEKNRKKEKMVRQMMRVRKGIPQLHRMTTMARTIMVTIMKKKIKRMMAKRGKTKKTRTRLMQTLRGSLLTNQRKNAAKNIRKKRKRRKT